ncbi:NADH:flavin oxidoreductase/nadh oxidase [Candidatus Sulfopaludibacter sp. SbA4]|nr:NADH:flavin oxidoreductase/nadh oxidase [Candidatus Sulfopaludibacter sp. SbA4]
MSTAETHLFTPLELRDVHFRNRIAVSPMCQYSSADGFANDWHLVHLASRAVGGAGLVMMEASAVEARGRISPEDHGIWKDEHIDFLARIASFVNTQGAAAGIQIAHAGRKASTRRPWEGGGTIPAAEGGWRPVAPSALPFRPEDPAPEELSKPGIQSLVDAFAAAAVRALRAGFQVLEIHGAHGYLIHEFLSPLSNRRSDEYGGTFENRIRFALEVTEAVRAAWPERLPLFLRISSTDWVDGGWSIEESVELARRVRDLEAGAAGAGPGSGPGRLLVGRHVARAEDSHGSGLPGSLRRAHPAGSGHSDGRGGADHHAAAGRRNRAVGEGGPGAAGARVFARSILSAACGQSVGSGDQGAGAVSQGVVTGRERRYTPQRRSA